MANVFDYLDWRGDLSFAQAPFCEVDNLILSLLAYLDYSESGEEELPLPVAAPLYFERHPRKKGALGLLLSDELQDLLEDAAASRRFGTVRLFRHCSELDEEREMQFSATTFRLGGGVSFVAFRGTDDTIVGWKEDFNMAVTFPVPAQEEACRYLDEIASCTADRLLVGGHSKGGNLAVYAAAFCSPQTRARIETVWCNDGPGFLSELLSAPGMAEINTRVRALMPRSGVVGSLLDSNWETVFIESSAVGALQHDGLTWKVLGPCFLRAEGQSKGSKQAEKTFHNLLMEMDADRRRTVIDEVFSVGREVGAKTLSELVADGRKRHGLRVLSEKLTGIEKETRESIFRALRTAFRDDESAESETERDGFPG